MMTPRKKANDLVLEMHRIENDPNHYMSIDNAKKCALIAVQEIIDQWEYIDTYLANLNGEFNPNLHYWQEVENELNKSE